MKISPTKVVPTAVVIVAAGVCTWPYLGGNDAPPPTSAPAPAASPSSAKEGPGVPAAVLDPKLPPRPHRDPFSDPEVYRAEARTKITHMLKSVVDERTKARQKIATRPATKPGVKFSTAKGDYPGDPLVLNATSVQGGRGMAIINGRTYGVGERIAAPSSPEPCLLAEVHARHVVIRFRGKKLPLEYGGSSARASASRPAAKRIGQPGDPLALTGDMESTEPSADRRPATRGRGNPRK